MRRPTIKDVAKQASVSGWTVSQVLNGRRNVSVAEDTRKRVLAAAEALGYSPNATAQALVTGRTQIIGLWMCLDYSRYRAQAIDCMQRLLRQSDYCIAITDIEEEIGRHHSFSRAARVPVDGVIAFDTPTAGSIFARANPVSQPCFVSMGAFWDENTSFVGVDLYAGSVEAVEHLISTGRRRIAFLNIASHDNSSTRARSDAYKHVLSQAGLEPHLISTSAISVKAAYESARDYLQSVPAIDAIFCLNDDLALGAYQAITTHGLQVGDEIALVGCDGIAETELMPCPITTIKQPVEAMCALAWQFLQTHIADPSTPLQQQILKPQLILRASSQR